MSISLIIYLHNFSFAFSVRYSSVNPDLLSGQAAVAASDERAVFRGSSRLVQVPEKVTRLAADPVAHGVPLKRLEAAAPNVFVTFAVHATVVPAMLGQVP